MPKQSYSGRREQEDWDEALEAFLLEHTPGLREYHAAQNRAFSQVEKDAYIRHPAPTPDDIGAAEAAEAALPSRKRTEAQLCVAALRRWRPTSQVRSSARGGASFSRVNEHGTEPTRAL
jgi:hypothetical protein